MADLDLDDDGPPDECVASWCEGEEWCSVTCTMDVIANKWHPIIVLLLLRDGPLGFSALQEDMGGVTGKVLSESLGSLVDDGVVEREVVSERPRRVEYSLTPAGEALEPVVVALGRWGDRYLSDVGFGAGGEVGAAEEGVGATTDEAGETACCEEAERDEPLDGTPPGGTGSQHAAAGYDE